MGIQKPERSDKFQFCGGLRHQKKRYFMRVVGDADPYILPYKILRQFKTIKGSQSLYYTGFGA